MDDRFGGSEGDNVLTFRSAYSLLNVDAFNCKGVAVGFDPEVCRLGFLPHF